MEIIKLDYIVLDNNKKTKDEMFDALAAQAIKYEIISNKDDFIKGLNDRENEVSTCFERGIAIPHCRHICVKKPAVLIFKNKSEIKWDEEGNCAQFIICLIIPEENGSSHIKLLSSIARKLVDDEFTTSLLQMNSKEEIYNCFKDICMKR